MNLTPKQSADIAKIYHEYHELMDELTSLYNAAAPAGSDRSEVQKKARDIVNNFVPRYKKTVPEEVQREIGLSANALESNMLITANSKT